MSYIRGWLPGSKAQEDPVKSTDQEKSSSAKESSEGCLFSSVINHCVMVILVRCC